MYDNLFINLQILAIRATVEGLSVDEESLAYLGEIGERTSLRFEPYLFGVLVLMNLLKLELQTIWL